MLAPMSEKTEGNLNAKRSQGFLSAVRAEFALLISLGTAAILIAIGNRPLEDVTHPLLLLIILFWLFATILWSAISVVRHADFLAIKLGEPYGTLILTLSAISIEVMMISTAMLHGANNPTLGRDAMFAVVMIALGGLVGLSLLLGGLRYREQHYGQRFPPNMKFSSWWCRCRFTRFFYSSKPCATGSTLWNPRMLRLSRPRHIINCKYAPLLITL